MPAAGARSLSFEVTAQDTALALGSGDLPVLGTPRALAMLEAATVAAAAGLLGRDETTVGAEVTLQHRLPTPVGRKVTATAELAGRDGRLLTFRVQLLDGDQVAAEGEISRVIVSRERFLSRLAGS
jgi:fluoroacetyl-CoA thioesterase